MNFRLLIIVVFFSYCQQSFADRSDNIHYSSRKEYIKVIDNKSGYTSRVEYIGDFLSESSHVLPIVYSELEEISDILPMYFNSKGKFKKLKEYKKTNASVLTSSFYAGYRTYLIEYTDAGDRFALSYTMKCKELMRLCELKINDEIKTDSYFYEIEIPLNYRLILKFPDNDTTIKIDSVNYRTSRVYTITAKPKQKITVENKRSAYENFNYSDQFIRILALPIEHSTEPWRYFNFWYKDLVEKQTVLNNETLSYFDQLTKSIPTDSIAYYIFDYVKTKISYIDYENGLGAYQPRNPNDIFKNKQGDCKDMANLICQLLKHYGYDSYYALAPTLDYTFKGDFPSLSSYNHVICVVKGKSNWLYLDATESQCKYGMPSISIQDQTIFVVNDKGGEIIKVLKIPSEKNEIGCHLYVNKIGNKLEANLEYVFEGLSQIYIKTAINSFNKNDFEYGVTKELERLLPNVQLGKDNYPATVSNDTTIIKASFINEKSVIKNGSKTFIVLNWLPYPHQFPLEISKGYNLITYQTTFNNIECILQLDEQKKVKDFVPVNFNKNGFEFSFSITQITGDKVLIKYTYGCDKLMLEDGDFEVYSELNKIITKTLNTALCYE